MNIITTSLFLSKFIKNKFIWLILLTNILILFGPYIYFWLIEPVPGCLRSEVWPDWLIYAFIAAEIGIFIPYTSIPISLGRIIFSRKDIPFSTILILTGGFIFSCALTHLVVFLTIYYPWYHLELIILTICAIISNATAFVLHRNVKLLINLPPIEAILKAKDAAEERAKMAEELAEQEKKQKEAITQAKNEAQAARKEAELLKIEAENKAKNEQNLRTIAEQNAKIAEKARQELEISLTNNKAITIKLEEALNEKDSALSQKEMAMKSVQELSTPVLPLGDGVLLSPIIGVLDSRRISQLMETILHAISNHQARIVIIDLTGVETIDTQVADAIGKTCAAVRLMGGICIITGIRPAVAQTMIALEIVLPDVLIENTLKLGLITALNKIKSLSAK